MWVILIVFLQNNSIKLLYYKIIILLIVVGLAYSQCYDLTENQCVSNTNCEWIENTNNGWCGNYNNNNAACNNQDQCTWLICQLECTGVVPSDCTEPECSYSWLEYSCTGTTTVSYCNGSTYETPYYSCMEIDYFIGDGKLWWCFKCFWCHTNYKFNSKWRLQWIFWYKSR